MGNLRGYWGWSAVCLLGIGFFLSAHVRALNYFKTLAVCREGGCSLFLVLVQNITYKNIPPYLFYLVFILFILVTGTLLVLSNFGTIIGLVRSGRGDGGENSRKNVSIPLKGKGMRIAFLVAGIYLIILSKTPMFSYVMQGKEDVETLAKIRGERGDTNIPNDALEYHGHYYAIYDNAESWEDAREKCELLGGHLVTITSAEENEKVYQYMREQEYESAYIGLHLQEKKPKKKKKKKDGKKVWKWLSGEKVVYINWEDGEPDTNGGGYGAYGQDDGAKWRAYPDCYVSAYLCEWDDLESGKKKERGDGDVAKGSN